MMKQYCSDGLQRKRGFALVELILFLGILAIILGAAMMVFLFVQESRIRQGSVAEVEQRGIQLLETFTKNIRRAEVVLTPAPNQRGSILALQMGLNAEFPTIFAQTATGNLLLIQKNDVSPLLNPHVKMSNLNFRNIGGGNVIVSFDLTTTIPDTQQKTYTSHFASTATLFPDDQGEAGGCGHCPVPSCVNHQERWYQCETDTCTLSTSTLAC